MFQIKSISKFQCVVLGVSKGGFTLLQTLFPQLRKDFPIPICIVQHRVAEQDDFLVNHLNHNCKLNVKDALDKEIIASGNIYLAPSDYHFLIDEDRCASLSRDEKISSSRPSIDVLFESAADVYGKSLLGIILSGMNFDGAAGVQYIKHMKGTVLVQDPKDAEADSMPLAAIATGEVDKVLTAQEIINYLNDF